MINIHQRQQSSPKDNMDNSHRKKYVKNYSPLSPFIRIIIINLSMYITFKRLFD